MDMTRASGHGQKGYGKYLVVYLSFIIKKILKLIINREALNATTVNELPSSYKMNITSKTIDPSATNCKEPFVPKGFHKHKIVSSKIFIIII